MHRSLRRIICSCIVPHEFKSRTVTVASVVIIFSTPYALRVSCKIDGFRSKDIYCLSIIMNNNNELYCYPFPLLQVIGGFPPRFMVHLQTSSIPLYDNLSSSFNSQCLLTCSFIPTPYQPSPRFFALFMFFSPSFNLSVCALQFPPPTIFVYPALPFHTLFLAYGVSVHLSCAFTLETTREPERWMTGAHFPVHSTRKSSEKLSPKV